ncbi:MAG: 50S ribosomal protein L9 [Elusimicrobia bacterium]|nr:50S ribosomal protein L9 [Elusimicrobiota bacterium]
MKVILRCDVEHVGRSGEVKDVSAGFGRNFLLPKNLAVTASSEALAWWEKGKERREKLLQAQREQAKELSAKMAGVSLSFSRAVGAEGKLFGSVGKSDIVKSLKSCGFTVDKQAVVLESAIKTAGDHEVELRLHPEVSAKIKVAIAARQ